MRMLTIRVVAAFVLAGMLVTSFAVGAEPASASAGFRFEAVSDASLGLWEGDKPVLVYNQGLI